MMAIFDILIYVCFAFYASSLARKSENYIEENDISPDKWDKYLIYFVLFFTVIGGIRWNVGSDNISYAIIFDRRHQDLNAPKELIWKYLVSFFQYFHIHWAFGLALCAFIQMYFITRVLKPYRWLLVFIPFVFFGGRYWQDMMGTIRQMMVGCGFLWASRFIYEKKLLKYLLFIFIGTLVHQSALILLPFYLIPDCFNIVKKRWLLISILIICVILGQVSKFSGLTTYVRTIADVTAYESYGDSMSKILLSDYENEALKFGPMMLTYLMIPLFIIWYGPELEGNYSKKIPYFNLWYILSFLYSCSYFLVCNLGHIFIRPVLYFSVFQLIIASLLLYYLCTEYKIYGNKQFVTYVFCFIIALNTSWDVYKATNTGRYFESVTYKVFLFNLDQLKFFRL